MSPVAFCLRRTPNTEVESAFLSAPLHYRLSKKSFSKNFHILCQWTCCPFTRAFVFQFAALYLSTFSLSLALSFCISAFTLPLFFFCPSLLITLCLFSSITLIKIHMYVYPLLDPIYRCLLSLIRLNTLCLKMTFCVEKLWNYSLGLNSAVSSDCTLLP